jgi:dienelactone hydrolase
MFGLTAVTLVAACAPALKLTPNDAPVVLQYQTLDASDPGLKGDYDVLTLYYGSGTDKNRPEYRDSVAITTPTVDASKMVSLGRSAADRNGYWGFTPKDMPLNARVWYPDGDGPFPLVLVVHGNHSMTDFSDPGYDYLGELLASRGYILASVDENFINGGINNENDARGWFLLKHLDLFDGFNDEEGNPFEGKIDMGNIALIGHSRGGEAVANATAFNRLSRYPDDASVEFDFNYDIKGVISIAPVDGQYLPTGRGVVMEDVSYLTFHGSHDGDVTSFHGLRIYDRLQWNDSDEFRFKSAIYVYRANHGQWNSSWGSGDSGGRSARFLDLRGLMPEVDQRRFAEIYVSAFFEAVLKGNMEYLPIFRDHRVIGQWLPQTMYVTRFETNADRVLASFEEDVDVTTGTEAGVSLLGEGLSTWKETRLSLRSSNRPNTSRSQENQAVMVGWSAHDEDGGDEEDGGDDEDDEDGEGGRATYQIEVGDRIAARWALGQRHALTFALAPTNGSEGENDGSGTPVVGVLLELEDAAGRTANVSLADYGPLRKPLEMHVMLRADRECRGCTSPWDLILQSFAIPLADFTDANADLDMRQLTNVRFVFDRTTAGEVVIDQIAFAELDPGFWGARVER